MTISKYLKAYGIKLKPINEQANRFVLKVSGFREYLMGPTPLAAYDRVRESLRGLKTIKVSLAEISSLYVSEDFPLIIHRDKYFVKKGFYEPVQWKRLEGSPLFLWYPPVSIQEHNPHSEHHFHDTDKKNNQGPQLEIQFEQAKKNLQLYKKCFTRKKILSEPNFTRRDKVYTSR